LRGGSAAWRGPRRSETRRDHGRSPLWDTKPGGREPRGESLEGLEEGGRLDSAWEDQSGCGDARIGHAMLRDSKGERKLALGSVTRERFGAVGDKRLEVHRRLVCYRRAGAVAVAWADGEGDFRSAPDKLLARKPTRRFCSSVKPRATREGALGQDSPGLVPREGHLRPACEASDGQCLGKTPQMDKRGHFLRL